MASPQAQSVKGSPQGETDQTRRPRPGAGIHYQTRLVCFLLNHLQENLAPHTESETKFFRSHYRTHLQLYRQGISPQSQTARIMDLESLYGLHTIQVTVRVHKYIQGVEKNYLIEAMAEGYAISDVPENYELGEVILCAGKKLRAVVCIGWKFFDGQSGGDVDGMGWDDVLLLLRKASKKAYNQFGEVRSDTEATEVGRTLGRWFELDDNLETQTIVEEGQPGNIHHCKVCFRRHGESR